MAKKNQKEEQSVLESPEALVEKLSQSEEFLKKNKNLITYVLIGVVAAVSLFLFFRMQNEEKESEAQAEMFNAQFYFEADSLNKALNGDGSRLGFLDIMEEYSGTKAANLSNFYAGVIYLKQGQFDEAISYLKEFSSSDLLIQARAYALIGDAYSELNNLSEAITYYKKASDYKANEKYTPIYLMKLGIAHEANSDYKSAIEAYDKIISEFPKSSELNDAKKRKARAERLG